jgi:DNA-binding transcriptional ArsR family regulator
MRSANLDDVFHALSDPTRREILALLGQGERSTGRLADAFPLSRPAISKHLRVLHDAALVDRRREGRNQIYALRAEPMAGAFEWLSRYQRFWRTQLRRLKRHVEEEGEWA